VIDICAAARVHRMPGADDIGHKPIRWIDCICSPALGELRQNDLRAQPLACGSQTTITMEATATVPPQPGAEDSRRSRRHSRRSGDLFLHFGAGLADLRRH